MVDAFRSRRRTIINTDPADYESLDLQCSDVVDRFQATAAELAASVVPNDPPGDCPHQSPSWSLQSATG